MSSTPHHQSEVVTPNTPVNGLGRSAIAGLLTGGPAGLLLSPLALYGVHKSGKRGIDKWTTWAACGIVGVPLSWALFAVPAVLSGYIPADTVAEQQTVQQSVSAAPSSPATALQVGNFTYSNISFSPYQYDGSADVAGKLIAVYADVVNTGNKSESPAYTYLYTLKDDKGREFKEVAFGVGLMDDGLTATNGLLPGQKRHVRIGIFDVSPDGKTYQLGIARPFGDPEYVQGQTEGIQTQTQAHAEGVQAQSEDSFGLQQGMPYEQARQILIQEGWHPRDNRDRSKDDLELRLERWFTDRGMYEVWSCLPTGTGACATTWTRSGSSDWLYVVTSSGSYSQVSVQSWHTEDTD